MRRAHRALLSVLAAVPFVFGATALAQSPTPVPVLDVEWTLTQLDGAAVPADPAITATFASDGTLTGSGGCNGYTATWASDGTTLTVTDLFATFAVCSEDIDARESSYFQLLQDAASWTLEGDAIIVTTSTGATIVYGGDSQAPSGLLLVGTWPLATVGGEAPPTGMAVTLDIRADGTLGGVACNDYSAGYTASESGDLSVDGILTTRKSCGDALDAFESDYLNGLQGATSWRTQDGQLVLSGVADLVFGDGPAAGVELTGQEWLLTSIGGAPIPESGITTLFGEDGSVAGSGGCNRYSGPYTVEGESLSVGELQATRMSCGITVDDLESTYLGALQAASGFAVSGTELVVETTSGLTLVYSTSPGPAQPSAAPASAAPSTPAASIPAASTPAASIPAASTPAASIPAASAGASDGSIVGSWDMTGFMGQSLPGSMLSIDITFAADGSFSGSGGCNGYTGAWTIEGTRLSITGFSPEFGGACDPMTQSFEQSFFGLLPFVDTAEVGADGSLSLVSAIAGNQAFVFAPAG